MPVAAQIANSQIVGKDENDVRRRISLGRQWFGARCGDDPNKDHPAQESEGVGIHWLACPLTLWKRLFLQVDKVILLWIEQDEPALG